MKTYLVALILSLIFATLASASDGPEVECGLNEVKVCFADGGENSCICKTREIELTDTVPQISDCYDPDDSGECED